MQLSNSPRIIVAVSEQLVCSGPGSAPEKDYQRLATKMNGILVGNSGFSKQSPILRRLERATALDIGQAKYILETYPEADIYFSFSERVGIPLAAMLRRKKGKRPIHVMLVHRIHSRPKRILNRILHWSEGVDRIITRCTTQCDHAIQYLPNCSDYIPKGIDEQYYSPGDGSDDGYILSVGSECRDYATLVAAVEKTPYSLKILSNSPWCRRNLQTVRSSGRAEWLPRVSYEEMLRLYRKSRLIVVPLYESEYAAGVNGVLEAFCVQKPVIASESSGMMDYLRDKENCFVVPERDIDALKVAINEVYNNQGLRDKLVDGGTKAILEYGTLEQHCGQLSSYLNSLLDTSM